MPFQGEELFDDILDKPFENIGTCIRMQYKTKTEGIASWKGFIVCSVKHENKYIDALQISDGNRDMTIKRREMVMIELDPENMMLTNRIRVLEVAISGCNIKLKELELRMKNLGYGL